jgi:O-glycosyl hydrolase
VYASIDSDAPDRTVIIAINKDTQARTAALTIAHPTTYTRASVWTLAGGEAKLVESDALSSSADNAFLLELPARSASVVVPAP